MKSSKKNITKLEEKTKPIYKRIISRNGNETSRILTSRNNISEIKKNETINFHNFPNSLISLDNSIVFNELYKNKEEYDIYMLYNKYLLSKSQYNKKISEINDIDNKLSKNNILIEKLEKNLEKLIQEKKEKQLRLVDLLSEKESLEEIYNIKIFSLFNKREESNINNIDEQIENKNEKEIETDKVKEKNENENNNLFDDSDIINSNIDETINNIDIKVDEIKQSDQKKFAEQVINFTEDMLQNKNIEIRNKLHEKVKMGYKIFLSEINAPSEHDINKIVDDFFLRISVFITNQSKGQYPENLINLFLKQLLKINIINVEIADKLKFLNKIYKNTKKELKERINTLNKKNENLKNKKISYENLKNELKKFIDENKDKIKDNENNITNIENDNKQYMSFILDSHFGEDFDFLNESKNFDTKRTGDDKNNLDFSCDVENNKLKEMPKRIKVNKILRNANYQNKLFRNHSKKEGNIIHNLNNFIIHYMPVENKNKKKFDKHINKSTNEINVNHLMINNNINIENNNNLINNNNAENKGETDSNNQNTDNRNSKTPKKSSTIFVSKINLKKNIMNNNNLLIPIEHHEYNTKNLVSARNFNYEKVNKTSNETMEIGNFMNIKLYKDLTQHLSQTFCYFKLSDKNNFNFNPLNSSGANPIKYNYFEGYLLIDKNYDKLKIIQKSEEKYIGIILRDIVDVSLSKQMENIIKIYDLYLKNGKNEENFDMEEFLHTPEIKAIRMQKNEKIIAINSKYFVFSIIMGKRFIPKVEFIFVNYDHFNSWYNCLKSIAKSNNI